MKLHIPDFLNNIKFEYKITFSYFIFGLLWILFSDKILDLLVTDESLLTEFQTFKGIFFIIVTTGFLYLLVKGHMQKLRIAHEITQKNDARYRNTLYQMLEGCQIIGFDWKYIYLNRSAEIHNRRSNNELLGNRYQDMWPGIEETEVFNTIKQSLETRVPNHFENQFVFPDGSQGWFDLSIQPVPEGVFILSIDISERKLKEEQLYQSEFRFSKLWENGPFGLMMVDQEFQDINVNPMFCKILGYSEAELQQLKFKDISHPDDMVKVIPNIRKLINREISVYKTEKRFIRKDGKVIWGAEWMGEGK